MAEVEADKTDRVERLLALLLLGELRGASQREKIAQLSLAGFSNVEIANLLQTTSAVVAQSLYEHRRDSTARKPRPKKPRRRA